GREFERRHVSIDHLLPTAQLDLGQQLGGPAANLFVLVLAKKVDARGLKIGGTECPALRGVEQSIQTFDTSKEKLGRLTSQGRTEPVPGLYDDGADACLGEAIEGRQGRLLDLARLAVIEQLGQQLALRGERP